MYIIQASSLGLFDSVQQAGFGFLFVRKFAVWFRVFSRWSSRVTVDVLLGISRCRFIGIFLVFFIILVRWRKTFFHSHSFLF